MKKYIVLCAGICAAMAFTSCKSSESAYKQAYLKAKAQEEVQTPAQQETVEQNVVAPLQERPATNTRVLDNADNVSVRQENVTVVSGAGLKNFSVVVGSFSLRANADGLQQTLRSVGYDAQIVLNSAVQPAMYRVVATTFDTKAEAAASRNDLQAKYPKKRTGLAVTDPLQIIAGGLATVSTSELFDYLQQYVGREPVERIVIGEPRQPNGQPSENLARVEQFVNRWRKQRPDIPIEYYDERFTSVLAHQAMLDAGLKRKARQDKALVDEISATIILEDYLRSKK